MNRLTSVKGVSTLIKNGWKKKDTESYTSICYGCEEIIKCVNKCGFCKALDKLAAYEDTGLEPEEVKNLIKEYNKDSTIAAHYEQLEEQGLLIKLPCKIGDFVFEAIINRNIISSYIITAIVVGKNSRNYKWGLLDGIYSNMNGFNEFALGKSVFLTREEAEKALEESNGE